MSKRSVRVYSVLVIITFKLGNSDYPERLKHATVIVILSVPKEAVHSNFRGSNTIKCKFTLSLFLCVSVSNLPHFSNVSITRGAERARVF